jgi:hypothetical protein
MTQRIKLTDGCPNSCQYCYEPNKAVKYYDMPIIKEKEIQILDMNFLSNPNWREYVHILAQNHSIIELVCGIDYRLLDQDVAYTLFYNHFIKIRWAWDYTFGDQKKHQKVWKMLKQAGYRSEDLSVFILANWKIPYVDCIKKLDLLKVWNVKVNDCCWDGGYKIAKPVYWTPEQIKKFRSMCRKHNQMVLFKIDPELKC